jgi:ribokinase
MPCVLNFGSLNIDYVYSVEHFVRAGETLAACDRQIFAGGKGLNQSIALAEAGARVFHAGCVGQDDGGILLSLLRAHAVNIDYIRKTAGPSGHTIIQVDASGQNCILLFGGANHDVSERHILETLSQFRAGDFLLLQNEISRVPFIARAAEERGLRIVYNPSPVTEDAEAVLHGRVDYLLVNEVEAEMLCGVSDAAEQLDALRARFPQTAIVLTRGKAGVFYADGAARYQHGIYDVAAVDTTAAGDTFTGFFIARLIHGDAVPDALKLASIASSIAVSRRGASSSIPSLQEVLNYPLTTARCSARE